MTRTPFLFFVLFAAAATRAACAGDVFEHAIYDAVPLVVVPARSLSVPPRAVVRQTR